MPVMASAWGMCTVSKKSSTAACSPDHRVKTNKMCRSTGVGRDFGCVIVDCSRGVGVYDRVYSALYITYVGRHLPPSGDPHPRAQRTIDAPPTQLWPGEPGRDHRAAQSAVVP